VDGRLSRRNFLSVVALVGVSGCDKDEPGPAPNSGPKTIQMSWWGSTDRHRRTQEALDAFTKRHADIKVTTQFSGWDGYWEKLATQTAGGNPPDVIQMDYSYIGEYARRGSLRALDDLVPKVLNLADFSAEALAGGKIDNKLYGVNAGINSMALIANLTLLKQTGLELPDQTMTWAGFADLTKTIGTKSSSSGVYGCEYAAYDGAALECWLRQRGKELFTLDGAIGFTAPDLAEWFAFWEDLRKAKGTVPADVQATAVGDVQNTMVARKKAMFDFAHSNQLTAYSSIVKDELALHMYPQGPAGSRPGQYLKPSQLMSVSARTRYPMESAKLIGALLTDPEIAAILGSERGIPPSRGVRGALKPKANPVEQKTYDYVESVGDKVGGLPPPAPLGGGEVVNKVLTFAGQQVSFGKVTIDQAVARFFEDAATALKK